MAFFKIKKEKIDKHDYHDAYGSEVYMVYWNTPDGTQNQIPHLIENKRVAKGFLSKEDAIAFKKNLEDAAELLQSTYRMNITIEKQK